MAAKKDESDELRRVGKALGSTFGNGEGGYEISSAFASPSRRKLMGRWMVEEHLVAGRPFIEKFQVQQLKGAEFLDAMYRASYEFLESLCVKRVSVEGQLAADDGFLVYAYRLAVALTWRPGPGKTVIVRPEMGYQMTSLGGMPAACRELSTSGDEIRISWRMEGRDLIFEEGDDRRLLRRA